MLRREGATRVGRLRDGRRAPRKLSRRAGRAGLGYSCDARLVRHRGGDARRRSRGREASSSEAQPTRRPRGPRPRGGLPRARRGRVIATPTVLTRGGSRRATERERPAPSSATELGVERRAARTDSSVVAPSGLIESGRCHRSVQAASRPRRLSTSLGLNEVALPINPPGLVGSSRAGGSRKAAERERPAPVERFRARSGEVAGPDLVGVDAPSGLLDMGTSTPLGLNAGALPLSLRRCDAHRWSRQRGRRSPHWFSRSACGARSSHRDPPVPERSGARSRGAPPARDSARAERSRSSGRPLQPQRWRLVRASAETAATAPAESPGRRGGSRRAAAP